MRKNVYGRQLKRDANERKALFKGLLSNLVLYERIKTTEAKAKAIRPAAEKLITKAKKGPSSTRFLSPKLNHEAVLKILNTIAPRFTGRNGGYTRIVRLGRRTTDGASTVLIEWTVQQTALATSTQSSIKSEAKEKTTPKKLTATIKTKKAEKVKKEVSKKEDKKKKEAKKK